MKGRSPSKSRTKIVYFFQKLESLSFLDRSAIQDWRQKGRPSGYRFLLIEKCKMGSPARRFRFVYLQTEILEGS